MAIALFDLVLLLIGVVIAFLTRKVPDRFNEANRIAMVLYALLFLIAVTSGITLTVQLDIDTFYATLSLGLLIGVLTIEIVLFGPRLLSVYHKPYMRHNATRRINNVDKVETLFLAFKRICSLLFQNRLYSLKTKVIPTHFFLFRKAIRRHVGPVEKSALQELATTVSVSQREQT